MPGFGKTCSLVATPYGLRSLVAAAFLLAYATSAFAAAVEGEWTVADKTARIHIIDCNSAAWGFVSWEKMPGGLDSKNPDPVKRGRTTLGMPILLGMKPAGANGWAGQIYDSDNGKFYAGSLKLISSDMLQVRGCLLGIFCGGENWTRAPFDSQSPEALGQCP